MDKKSPFPFRFLSMLSAWPVFRCLSKRKRETRRILRIDHLVLTTQDLARCLDFYVNTLGMRHEEREGRHALYFGCQKINIHTALGEFQPAADKPTPGSLDLCLAVEGGLDEWLARLQGSPYAPITGVVARNGALGPMMSIYVRDPDGNLVELSQYGG